MGVVVTVPPPGVVSVVQAGSGNATVNSSPVEELCALCLLPYLWASSSVPGRH